MKEMKEMNGKTGYISGIFDSIDRGTLETLMWCREHCSDLVVGVYSDALACRILDRPAEYTYERRAALLEQLSYVDRIVEVGWDSVTREGSFRLTRYDVCFYASEYGQAFEEDRRFCSDNGIELLPLPGQKACLFGSSLKFLLENSSDRDIVLFGTGKYFERYMEELGGMYPPAYAVDNDRDRQGTVKCGVRIYGTERLKDPSGKKPLVIVCAKNHDPMVRQLKDLGGIDYRTLVCNDGFAVFDEAAVLLKEEASYMKGAHRLLMLLLIEFDRVCRKYGIKYFLNDGSLLGAVRHQALIPWDDDADVTMFRDDYEKLRTVAAEEWGNDGSYELVTPDRIGKNVFHDFMSRLIYKDEKIRTGIFAKTRKKLREELRDTMCLDVYVMDSRNPDEKVHGRQVRRIQALYGLAMGHRERVNFDDYNGQSRFVRNVIRCLVFAGRFIPLGIIFGLFDRTCRRYDRVNRGSGVVYESNAPLCCLPARLDRSLLGDGTNLKVCGHAVMVPEHYAEYLEAHGYRNFMEYPPGNMRKPTHSPKSRGIMYRV